LTGVQITEPCGCQLSRVRTRSWFSFGQTLSTPHCCSPPQICHDRGLTVPRSPCGWLPGPWPDFFMKSITGGHIRGIGKFWKKL